MVGGKGAKSGWRDGFKGAIGQSLRARNVAAGDQIAEIVESTQISLKGRVRLSNDFVDLRFVSYFGPVVRSDKSHTTDQQHANADDHRVHGHTDNRANRGDDGRSDP